MTDFGHELQILLRLGLAVLCGSVLGFERECHGRSAGLRTNLLVSLGSALMTVVSENFFRVYGGSSSVLLRMDPSRVAAQIVVGIGFIGAGVIIKETGGIRGLTTAATLWLVAGVGMACGTGMFFIASATTLIALVALTILKEFEKNIPRDNYRTLEIVCSEKEENRLSVLSDFFREKKLYVQSIGFSYDARNGMTTYEFSIMCRWCEETIVETTRELLQLAGVSEVKLV